MPTPGVVFQVAPPVNRPGHVPPVPFWKKLMSVPPVHWIAPSMLPVWNAVKLFVVTTSDVNTPERIAGGTSVNVLGTSRLGGSGANTASGVGSAYTSIVPPTKNVV